MTPSIRRTNHCLTPAALMLGACIAISWTTTPAQAGLLSISEKEEIDAGRKVAVEAERQFGRALPANHPMSRRVRAMGMQFARLSERKNIPYSYKVLNNDKVLNAFAGPGGPIFVTKKLVETTSNDAELAYVLGHETAHIDRKHIVKTVEKQQKVGLIAGIFGAILSRGKSGNIIGTAANVAFTVWSSGYSRDHETESDTVGVRWMSRLGYDPRAAVSMLGKLGSGGSGILDKYLSTHPAPKDRQARVQKLISQESLLDVSRRSGGPRLSANLSSPDTSNSIATADAYPPDDYNATPVYYPPADDDSPQYLPPRSDEELPASQSSARELNLGAPLRVLIRRDYRVIMAPVAGLARWAGASLRTNDRETTVQRGNNRIELRRYSTVAYIDGRTVEMSAAPEVYDGVLYAPLGSLAEGIGADATLDENSRLVRLTLDNGTSGFVRLPS